MEKFTITEQNAIDLLEQRAKPMPVQLVAIDYNWGPPVSGRFDNDFCQIWAAVRKDLKPKEVRLLGNYDRNLGPGQWSDALVFEKRRDCGELELYFLDSPLALATEFVVAMLTTDGRMFYDNNGGYGINYRLVQYMGRGTTAIVAENAIYKLNGITPITLLRKSH
jgi:hypothetical protein